jgi:hypothetical protein
MTAAEEWIDHVERCDVCGAGTSCPAGERLLRAAAELTAVRVCGYLIDVSEPAGTS